MRVAIGTRVITSDGQDAGTIDRLILDPAAGEVRAAVISKGLLLPRDVEVSLPALEPGPDGTLRLAYTAAQLDHLPDFFESNYTATPPVGATLPYGYGAGGMLWPAGYGMLAPAALAYPSIEADTSPAERAHLRRQDLENAVVGEGSAIISRDGESVGSLGRLDFDPETGRLTRLVVSQGLIFTRETALPASVIARADDHALYLTLDKAAVDAWARLDAGQEVRTRDGAPLGTIRRQTLATLEVEGATAPRWLRVPLAAVARLHDGHVELAADAADAARWAAPPSGEPPTERIVQAL